MPASRLYASAIAVVSGVYAIGSALEWGTPMAMGDAPVGIGFWVMMVVGAVVLVHGLILLTPIAARLGRVSGPLMIVWAAVMLAQQALAAWMPGFGMAGSGMSEPMNVDAGMVAIAVLMLVSGVIMSLRGRDHEMTAGL